MRVAYAQPGALPSAFCPVPAYDGRGLGPWQAKGNLDGQPGTEGIPVALPEFGRTGLQANGVPVRGGGGGYAQGSGTMPGVWYPQLWWLRQLDGATLVSGNVQTMSVYSDNQLPVPASDPLGRAALLATPPTFLGARAVGQPAGSRAQWAPWLATQDYGG